MSKIIKKSAFLRSRVERLLDLSVSFEETEHALSHGQIQAYMDTNEEYIDLEFIKNFKILWNFYFPEEKLYIYQILAETQLYLPVYKPTPRNPVLEKRVQELRARFDNEAYQKMVFNVDRNSALKLVQDSSFMASGYSADFRTIQGQIIVIVNAVACIIGSFFFGYKAVYYSLNEPNINYQMIGGFMTALLVAFAEIWFLFKKLNEMDNLNLTKATHNRELYKSGVGLIESPEIIHIKSNKEKKMD